MCSVTIEAKRNAMKDCKIQIFFPTSLPALRGGMKDVGKGEAGGPSYQKTATNIVLGAG